MTLTQILGQRIAAEALALVGTRFRLHGRDPATGLDCIGLAAAALHRAGVPAAAPAGYRLRNTSIAGPLALYAQSCLMPVSGEALAGDLLLVTPGPAQHHLLVTAGAPGFIHAHAGLGRVVLTPGPVPWPILHHWRAHTKG